jgi:hypothetical protein
MFKKVLVATILALSMFATIEAEAYHPPPTCNPCPQVY